MATISFTVYGKPATAGSKRGFPFRREDGKLGVRMAHDNPRFDSWRQEVAKAALQCNPAWLEGPLLLGLTYLQVRPRSHYRTGANAHLLRASAPQAPTGKPDITKITRALEDSLTRVIWHDDSQVISVYAHKRYIDDGTPERIEVMVAQCSPASREIQQTENC